ncbi:CLUMA_CG014343, isoform A [Clunio marinus]|uniref:CLUMA_CG014343, isoform A n=1 Tax=Clunio marinus TaxID=568069 RepID=A0A1J1IMY8_9DIPT|nr:CLUMA_CG014343, isoform A [Clunio marinus]
MRDRTKMVSNTGSDYDENEGEFEADDGSDDWKPEVEETKKVVKKTPKRKITATKTSAKKKKLKKDDSDEESENSEEEEEENEEDEEDEEEDESMDTSSKSNAKKSKKAPSEADARNFPDRQGIFSLYAYKGDLKNGLRANTNICLWRRDGQSLLQKYLRDKESKGNSIYFNSSMVYSCWEDRRKDEFLEVKVKCVANSGKDSTRDSKVELVDINGIEQACIDGKFHELELEPYVSYADKKKEEDAMNGTTTSQTVIEEEEEEEVSEGEE